jgi:hypothetical protein
MDFKEKAFNSVQETTKLLMTLATGFIAFTVAFAKDFMNADFGRPMLKTLWLLGSVFLVVSVACGIWTQLGITTVLAPSPNQSGAASIPEGQQTIRHKKIKTPFALQLLAFGAGIILLAAYQAFGVWTSGVDCR